MRILITGASGFLGRALTARLAGQDHRIAVLARPKARLDHLEALPIDIGRFENDEEIAEFVAWTAPDVLVHAAGLYGRHDETDQELEQANVALGLSLLRALNNLPAKAAGRRTFINTGSALEPLVSRYAETKRRFSALGHRIARADTAAARFVNVELQHMYGPGDDVGKFTAMVIRSCRDNVPELKLTAGAQRRDFVFIEDVLTAYQCLIERSDGFGPSIDVPLGSGIAPTVREFVEKVHAMTGSHTRLLFGTIANRDNEAMLCRADLRTLALLGWTPKWSLEDGLRETLKLESS